MIETTDRRMTLSACFAALTVLASVPFFVRHPQGGWLAPILYAGLVVGLLTVATSRSAARYARSSLLAACGVLGLAIGNLFLFPGTRLVEHPSSAPDALSLPFARLLAGLEPYGGALFDGAPISPGPGWIALHGAVTSLGLVPLIVPTWLGLAAWQVHRSGGATALFVALTMVPLVFLQMSVVGHDIFAISLAFTTILLAAFRIDPRGGWFTALALLAGTVATARLPLIVLLPVIGLGLARQRGTEIGVRFAALAIAAAAFWYGAAGLWCAITGDFFQPAHLFGRASGGAGQGFTAVGLVAGLAACYWIWRTPERDDRTGLIALWLLQTALFLPIGVGELVNIQHFAWADWEGKNYVAYPLPLLAAALALGINRSHQRR